MTDAVPTPAPIARPGRLTPRQERFCQHYMSDPNATRSAVAAGYSPRTARAQGSRLLAAPGIARRIRALQAGVATRSCNHADALMAKLEGIYLRALDNHHFDAARKAVENQARLAGFVVDRPPSGKV